MEQISLVGNVVKIKNSHILVVRQFKALDELLYVGIELRTLPPNSLVIVIDENNTNWYPTTLPVFLSGSMLENADVKSHVSKEVCKSIMNLQGFKNNLLELLPEVLMPIMRQKYREEDCINAYNMALTQYMTTG